MIDAEAEQSLEPSANKLTNIEKTLPSSLQTSSSEEADNNKENSEKTKNHLKQSKKKKKKIKKRSDGASETAPESRVPSELHEAIKVLEENCYTTNLVVHPTMIAALGPLTIVTLFDGRKGIQYNNVDCNHNTPNLKRGYEIINNVLNNPLNNSIDNERTLGGDQQLFAVRWGKVCQGKLRSFIF